MTRTYDPYTLRMLQVDGAHQFASGYIGMGNNSVNGIDPDGQVVIAALTGFFRGLFAKKENFVNPNDNRFENGVTKAGILAQNSARMWAGWFKTDSDLENKNRAGQIISRLTWELPQSLIGFLISQTTNLTGRVENVSYYGGATVSSTAGSWGGITLGSYIIGDNRIGLEASPDNALFQHEFGHYLQSQKSGYLYLFKYGIPNLWDTSPWGSGNHDTFWTEQDANLRAFNYFVDNDKSFSGWNNINNPIIVTNIINPKWWEYPLGILHPFSIAALNLRRPR